MAAKASDQGARTERTSGHRSATCSHRQAAGEQVGQSDGASGTMRSAGVMRRSLRVAGCLVVKPP